MRAVKRSGTALESRFSDILQASGLAGYERQAKELPGTPDFVFREARLALFIDSCFWHGCPEHFRRPSSNEQYWDPKIAMNQERDVRQSEELRRLGWRVERVWEHELRDAPALSERLKLLLPKAGI